MVKTRRGLCSARKRYLDLGFEVVILISLALAAGLGSSQASLGVALLLAQQINAAAHRLQYAKLLVLMARLSKTPALLSMFAKTKLVN